MPGLEADCADSAQQQKVFALGDGVGAGLELVDLQGALMSAGYNSPWRSIKSRAEMPAGFWHAPRPQQ
jgi:hypothetical protein